ncbi:MAG: hypothetical protein QUV18_13755 [Roseovarius sp.]|nr:hypothetical protein [Roseovarius sp.]
MLNKFENSQFVAKLMFATARIVMKICPRLNLNWVFAPLVAYRRRETLLLD